MMNGQADPYVRAAIKGEVARLTAAAVGERNQILFKSTAALASLGMREGEIIHHLKPVAEGIGLRGRELYSTIKSGVRTGHSNPRVVSKSQAHDYSAPVSVPPLASQSVLPARSSSDHDGRRPAFFPGGDDGPRTSRDEVRRHVFRRDGKPVRSVSWRRRDMPASRIDNDCAGPRIPATTEREAFE